MDNRGLLVLQLNVGRWKSATLLAIRLASRFGYDILVLKEQFHDFRQFFCYEDIDCNSVFSNVGVAKMCTWICNPLLKPIMDNCFTNEVLNQNSST